jgi:hypothetical protein
MREKRLLQRDGLAEGKWLLVVVGLLVVLLGSITIRRLAPAADIPMGAHLESGFNFVTTDPPRIACNRLEQLQVLSQLSRDSTPDSVERYYRKQYPSCRRLKSGKPARVDDRRGLLAGSVCVRLQGSARCMWTVRDAITRE